METKFDPSISTWLSLLPQPETTLDVSSVPVTQALVGQSQPSPSHFLCKGSIKLVPYWEPVRTVSGLPQVLTFRSSFWVTLRLAGTSPCHAACSGTTSAIKWRPANRWVVAIRVHTTGLSVAL